ncbi:MAG: T9SS type A sorting domain-containing protein [Bacteroidaceae bacterium]|nr:T9SS type A sorting domain-containing protein [Bacteroidaceae bacterium]
MKKNLFIAAMLLCVSNSFAQLVVDSLGRVGIGHNVTPNFLLTVDSHNEARERRHVGYFNCAHEGLFIENKGVPYESSENLRGIRIESQSSSLGSRYMYGIQSVCSGHSNNYFVCGLMGQVDGVGEDNVGVLGFKSGTSGYGAGICGMGGYPSGSLPSFSDTYAGYFYGNVHVTGSLTGALLTSTVNSPSVSSGTNNDGETTETRVITDESSELVSDKLQQVQLLQFMRDKQPDEKDAKRIHNEDTKEIEEENGDTIVQTKLSTIQYGLAADQLKEVYPELVYEDENGNVSINYVEMVPLLVQSINELSRKINELEGKGTSTKKAKTRTTAMEESTAEVDMVRMDQNKPNPFSESTVIKLNIPKDTKSATIFIYDLSGKQVKSIPISERGKTDITVYASDLTSGMYIYNLVVDGQVKVTRKMIVSEI